MTLTFAFSANDVEKVTTVNVELTKIEFTVESNLSLELANVQSSENTVFPCCVRECILVNGVWYCSEWVCGDCIIIIQ